MRAGAGFGVVLHAEGAVFQVAQTGDRAVIQVHMGHFDILGKRGGVHRIAVILRSDGDFSRAEVFNGLVASAMAELEFEGASPEGESENLVAKADAEERFFPVQAANGLTGVIEGLGVAGAI